MRNSSSYWTTIAHLYKKAAEKILAGQFAINPYTENGRSIAPYVQQHQAITGFEAITT